MPKWQEAPAVEQPSARWMAAPEVQPPAPVGAGMLPAAAAGASRGILGVPDIIPRGLTGLYNVLTGQQAQAPSLGRLAGAAGIGTYQPQTPGEERAAFAGEIAGASLLPGAGMAARAAAPLRTAGIEAAATGGSILGGLAGGELGGETGRTLGAVAGGLAPTAAPFAARRLVSPYAAETMASRLEAAQRQGVPITAGQAAGGSFLEKASATMPGGQRVAETFAGKQAERMGERVNELVKRRSVREPSSESAGRAIQRGLDDWVAGFKARGGELYNEVDTLIPKETATPLSNTRRTLEELTTEDPDLAKVIDAPLVRSLSKVLSGAEGVPYEVASKIRTRIGSRLASPGMLADAPTGELKSIYGAISRDLEDVARAAGPEAERAAGRAAQYWKAGHRRVDDFLEPLQAKKLPEQAYQAAMAGTKEGASRLRALKKSLGKEQWDLLVATTLRRLGRARPSERTLGDLTEEAADFSPESFLTNLQQLDSSARKALFTGGRYEGLEGNLADLVSVAQGIRSQRQMAFNPSGTAGGLTNLSPLMALPFLNPMQTARMGSGLLGNVAMQKALQSPAFSQYMASPTQMVPGTLGQLTRAAQASGLNQ